MSEQNSTGAKKPYIRKNSFVFEGRVVADATVKAVGEKQVMSFAVAYDSLAKVGVKPDGTQDHTTYMDCESWNPSLNSLFASQLKKSTEVQIEGTLRVQKYTREGESHVSKQPIVTIESVKLITTPRRSEAAANA